MSANSQKRTLAANDDVANVASIDFLLKSLGPVAL